MRAVGCCLFFVVFFALGCVTANYPLPTFAKTVSYLEGSLAKPLTKALPHLRLALALFDFTVAALMLGTKGQSKALAMVITIQICVLCHIFLLGNCFLPSLTEPERLTAVLISYKAIGVLGGLILV